MNKKAFKIFEKLFLVLIVLFIILLLFYHIDILIKLFNQDKVGFKLAQFIALCIIVTCIGIFSYFYLKEISIKKSIIFSAICGVYPIGMFFYYLTIYDFNIGFLKDVLLNLIFVVSPVIVTYFYLKSKNYVTN